MAHCPFEILGLKPSGNYNDRFIRTAYRNLSLKHHPDKPGGNHQAFIELQNAFERVEKKDRRSREYHRWKKRHWCQICRSIEDDLQDHQRLWHRCCVAGCDKTGISLFDHLINEHQFQRCDSCHTAQSLSHFELYHSWWWCTACEGFAEEGTIERIQHLDCHLLRPCSRILYGEREALAVHVGAQQYRKCPACHVNIVTGKLVQHLISGHSFVPCDNCPNSEDETTDHILSTHPTSRCSECQEVHQKNRLRFHLRLVHRYQQCPDCKEDISPSRFEEHVLRHQQLSCSFCNTSSFYKSRNALRVHISRYHRQENREQKTKQQCPVCYEHVFPFNMERHRGSESCRIKAATES